MKVWILNHSHLIYDLYNIACTIGALVVYFS